MRFGPVPVEDAEGAILAHTTRLEGGALKKGRRLDAADVARLAAAGYAEVIAARLDEGDVPEDEAAARLARAIAGPGVRVDAAKTGRANLFAERRGLVVFDASRLEAVNLVDPSLTVATRPAHDRVEVGDMVATVKIIPFAVPGEALARATASGPLLQIASFRPRPTALILTELPGVQEAQLRRGAEAQAARLRYLDVQRVHESRCAHTEEAVQAALQAAVDAGAELLLVLGASAIVDPADVIPEGLRRAGGTVTHLGMPVDPGNLLMLGDLRGRPVLGVPGCARSLKRSGFDAVLERLVAGLEVTPQDIMRMGAGGLLSEIASRPAPREPVAPHPTPRVAAIVLAAGLSRRMGEKNKLLETVDGAPMLVHVVDHLLASKVSEVVVVTGHEAAAVKASLQGKAVRFVHNPDFAEGMASSVRAGSGALEDDVDGALVALGDMPWVRAEHVDRLLAAFDPRGPHTIVVPVYGNKRGNPVLWSRRHFPEMRRLTGDVGARALIEAHHEAVSKVAMPDEATQLDVDTPQALASLTKER